MRRIAAFLPVALALAGPAWAAPAGSSTPYSPPTPITNDLGLGVNGCPYIAEFDGQSVQVGQDHVGPHNNPPNTFIANATGTTNATAFEPAVYGVATALKLGTDGAGGQNVQTSIAANTYVVPAMSFAWYLRQSGRIPASRPIILTGTRVGAQPIGDWVDANPADLWSPLVAQYSLLNAGLVATDGTRLTYPGAPPCPINHDSWNQAQNNASGLALTASASGTTLTVTVTSGTITPAASLVIDDLGAGLLPNGVAIINQLTGSPGSTGTYQLSQSVGTIPSEAMETNYASAAGYLSAFARLIAKYQSLPNWSPQTRMDVAEMGTWAGATGSTRNDALRQLENGCIYPFVTMSTSRGMAVSTDNPPVHPNGYAEDRFGLESFIADVQGQIGGAYRCPAMTGVRKEIHIAASQAYVSSEDDIRGGANFVFDGAGSSLQLPNAYFSRGEQIEVYGASGGTLTSASTMYAQNNGSAVASLTLSAGVHYKVNKFGATAYLVTSDFTHVGDQYCFASNGTYNAGTTFPAKALAGVCYTLNATATFTLTPGFGTNGQLYAASGTPTISVSSGTLLMPDGSTPTSFTMQAGQYVGFVTQVSPSLGFLTIITFMNQPAPGYLNQSTVATLPACSATTKGLTRDVTDANGATWGSTITGGGTQSVIGLCNGTTWVAH